jgi:hypothetical protein
MIAAPAGKRQNFFSIYENINIRLLPTRNQQIKRENKKRQLSSASFRMAPSAQSSDTSMCDV